MLSNPRALTAALTLSFILALAGAASAATPAGGTVSNTSPDITWTGTAPGYLVDIVNSLDIVRTCLPNICDGFDLEVADAGDLTISVTANGTSGFTQVHVIRPDGSIVSNDGADGNPTSELRIKDAEPGTYFVATHTNAPIVLADASYHAFASLAGGSTTPPDHDPLGEGHGEGGVDDVTVIAVIDSALNPYHWDFLASKMPQTTNADPGDDLPLDRPASEWLDGFPAASDLASFERLDLSLEEDDATESMTALSEKDGERWAEVPRTAPGEKPHVVWMPRTKVIAAASFGTVGADPITGTTRPHSSATTRRTVSAPRARPSATCTGPVPSACWCSSSTRVRPGARPRSSGR